MTEEDIPSKTEHHKKSKPARVVQIEPHDLFFRRVLHLAAYKILTLSDEIKLDDDIKEQIWEVMKK